MATLHLLLVRRSTSSPGHIPNQLRASNAKGRYMVAYVIVDIEVTDPAAFEDYRSAIGANIAAFGGRYLARGGTTEVLEGNWTPKRLVILEFPTMARLKEWYNSPEYAPLLNLRKASASSNLVITDGI
jgi:uncharacterized protein (DUF1330 family)